MKKMFLALFVLTLAAIVLTPSTSRAVGKLEKLLVDSPHLFQILALGSCILIGIAIFVYNYFSGREEAKILKQHQVEKKTQKKQIIRTQKKYDKIPKGQLDDDISLPPAKLVQLGSNKEYELSLTHETTIGRSLENDIVIKRSSTSRHHAKIRPEKEGYALYDLLSKARTHVNREAIIRNILRDGDIIEIGRECFIFRLRAK